MKKTFLFLLLILVFISACEKDDFCLQNPVTPSLVIRFYDNTNRETPKRVQRLSIIAEGRTDSLFVNSALDSIAIPLNVFSSETKYILKKNATNGATANNEIANFTITYDTQEDYVSRSCGYKVTFNNVTFSADANSWITDFTPTTITTINNQNTAHVQIFH
ncbi:DUF6452 family protein [Polaribacter aestuariivivens]|uniref:DUF6452 family protein n=1 Tax=Polaribacter aestuariivivens TaxID=2304626 RepID=UPI003F498596